MMCDPYNSKKCEQSLIYRNVKDEWHVTHTQKNINRKTGYISHGVYSDIKLFRHSFSHSLYCYIFFYYYPFLFYVVFFVLLCSITETTVNLKLLQLLQSF